MDEYERGINLIKDGFEIVEAVRVLMQDRDLFSNVEYEVDYILEMKTIDEGIIREVIKNLVDTIREGGKK